LCGGFWPPKMTVGVVVYRNKPVPINPLGTDLCLLTNSWV
jgi:hypothetical protein